MFRWAKQSVERKRRLKERKQTLSLPTGVSAVSLPPRTKERQQNSSGSASVHQAKKIRTPGWKCTTKTGLWSNKRKQTRRSSKFYKRESTYLLIQTAQNAFAYGDRTTTSADAASQRKALALTFATTKIVAHGQAMAMTAAKHHQLIANVTVATDSDCVATGKGTMVTMPTTKIGQLKI